MARKSDAHAAASYVRNIQGRTVELKLVEVDPNKVKLDPTNPRIGFSVRQLPEKQRNEGACALLLTSQEETEALKRSIIASNGVQEPIYLRSDGRVAEGNRRVVALRSAQEDFPRDARFSKMPAWLIPASTPEHVVQDLLNEIHLGSVRGWAPYERALQMRALVDGGLIEEEVAERYRMTTREVKQQLAAVQFMNAEYFPITEDPTDSEHRAKFSYFLEFYKNTKIQKHNDSIPDLPQRFAKWVRDGRLDTGARVRRLPKILNSKEATRLLDGIGFEAADEYLAKQHPEEQELYAILDRTRQRLSVISLAEVTELSRSKERQEILTGLQDEISTVLQAMKRVRQAS
jgi:hypothetical protein